MGKIPEYLFPKCFNMEGASKTWDLLGHNGTQSGVLGFCISGSRVPGFDIIAITDLLLASSY